MWRGCDLGDEGEGPSGCGGGATSGAKERARQGVEGVQPRGWWGWSRLRQRRRPGRGSCPLRLVYEATDLVVGVGGPTLHRRHSG